MTSALERAKAVVDAQDFPSILVSVVHQGRTIDLTKDDLRALVAAAVALDGLRHDNYPTSCWCDVAIGNPNFKGKHSPQCRTAQDALNALEDRDDR